MEKYDEDFIKLRNRINDLIISHYGTGNDTLARCIVNDVFEFVESKEMMGK